MSITYGFSIWVGLHTRFSYAGYSASTIQQEFIQPFLRRILLMPRRLLKLVAKSLSREPVSNAPIHTFSAEDIV